MLGKLHGRERGGGGGGAMTSSTRSECFLSFDIAHTQIETYSISLEAEVASPSLCSVVHLAVQEERQQLKCFIHCAGSLLHSATVKPVVFFQGFEISQTLWILSCS